MRNPAEKRAKIMAAARQLFYEKSFNTVSMEDIAKMASVGKGTIYNNFESKNDLLAQLAKDVFVEFERAIRDAVEKSDTFFNFILLSVNGMFENIKIKSKILFLFHKELHVDREKYKEIISGYKRAIDLSFEKYKNEISVEKMDFRTILMNFFMASYLTSNDIDESKLQSIAVRTLSCALKKQKEDL